MRVAYGWPRNFASELPVRTRGRVSSAYRKRALRRSLTSRTTRSCPRRRRARWATLRFFQSCIIQIPFFRSAIPAPFRSIRHTVSNNLSCGHTRDVSHVTYIHVLLYNVDLIFEEHTEIANFRKTLNFTAITFLGFTQGHVQISYFLIPYLQLTHAWLVAVSRYFIHSLSVGGSSSNSSSHTFSIFSKSEV